MKKIVFGLLLPILLVACNAPTAKDIENNEPYPGVWKGVIALNDSVNLPFNFELETAEDSSISLYIFNGDEEIKTSVSRVGTDSIKIEMPVFANYIMAKLGNDKLEGTYINPDA